MDKLLVLALVVAVFYSCYLSPASAACKDKPANERYYRDCKDALEQGQACSGIYTIQPEGTAGDRVSSFAQPPFDVYCDMETDGGGWTVFQFRMNGSQNFYLNWDDYVHGFGNLNGEFWLGLSKIHRLTSNSSQTTTLQVDLGDFDGNTRYAQYSTFRVGDSVSKYTLTVSGYSGTAGDSLAYHNGRQFSTKDRDNDATSGTHCAQQQQGAWWYRVCHYSNLNGYYYDLGSYSPTSTHDGPGVVWYHWKGYRYSQKVTEMKMRRV